MITLSYIWIMLGVMLFIAIDYSIRKLLLKDYSSLLHQVSTLEAENTSLKAQNEVITNAANTLALRVKNLEIVETAWKKILNEVRDHDAT